MADKKDLSTAILDNRKGPNKLTMEQSVELDDNSLCIITQAKMDELKIYNGDTVVLKGKKRKETICTVMLSEDVGQPDSEIRTNKCVRRNIRCRMGDTCNVKPIADVPNGVTI
jgi:transitional endoplasmic reticulum ATPase